MNEVVLVGRLTSKPELRYTNSNKAVSNSTIAIKRNYGEETDFIMFQVWGKLAENLTNYCDKGALIGIKGEIRVENFEDKDGNKRTKTYVLANSVTFLQNKKKEEKSQSEIVAEVMTNEYEDFGKQVTIDDIDNLLD